MRPEFFHAARLLTLEGLTMSDMKTIRMPRELGEKWLAALRSGEYKQCAGVLKDTEVVVPDSEKTVTGHCCLGVLQEVADGDCERVENELSYAKLPSAEWLDNHNIMFRALRWDNEGNAVQVATYPNTENDVYLFVGESTSVMKASEINDDGTPFAEIADMLEQHMEYVD